MAQVNLPGVRIYVFQDNLVACDGFSSAVEDEETRRCGALINASHEPMLLQLSSSFGNASWQGWSLNAEALNGRAAGLEVVAHDVLGCCRNYSALARRIFL